MHQKTQKLISAGVVAFASIGGFEAAIYILNINQPVIYLRTAFWIFLYLAFMVVFLFDLHFKQRGSWQRAKQRHEGVASSLRRNSKIVFSALWDRFEHLRRWSYLRQWLHFLLLPGFIFWSSITLFYLNFGFYRIQQTLVLLSSAALVLNYWYLKEAFYRRKEIVDSDIFIVLTVVKIFAIGDLYAASLAILRHYCLSSSYFVPIVFGCTFLLVYQALYQHRLVTLQTVYMALLIAAVMGAISYPVYIYWAYNYFTAAIFMTACYNLFWGVFHYHLDHALTRRAFLEIFLVTLLVVGMVVSITNFRAKILDGCNYTFLPGQSVTFI